MTNPPRRVGAELRALRKVETFGRLQHAGKAFLHQVFKLQFAGILFQVLHGEFPDEPDVFNAKVLASLFVALLNQAHQKFVGDFDFVRLLDDKRRNFGGHFLFDGRGGYFVDEFNLQFVLNGVADLVLFLARQEAENFIESVICELIADDVRTNFLFNVLRVHDIFSSRALQPRRMSS